MEKSKASLHVEHHAHRAHAAVVNCLRPRCDSGDLAGAPTEQTKHMNNHSHSYLPRAHATTATAPRPFMCLQNQH